MAQIFVGILPKVAQVHFSIHTMTAGSYVVRYQNVVSQRCDTKELRKLLGDALDPYMKRVESRRFSVK